MNYFLPGKLLTGAEPPPLPPPDDRVVPELPEDDGLFLGSKVLDRVLLLLLLEGLKDLPLLLPDPRR